MRDPRGERIGLAQGYDASVPVREMAGNAAAAEAAGFDWVFFSETLFTNRDSVSSLAAFSHATERVVLGTTQVVRLRTPLLMAQTAATLDELSGGRIVLVVGAFTAKHAARNGVDLTDPISTLREYVESIRLLLSGERVSYHGSVVRFSDVGLPWQPQRTDIPIWIASTTRKGLTNAAGLADGVLLDAGASPGYTANAVQLLRRTCEDHGRDPDELTVAQLINTSIEDDPAVALDAVRWEISGKFQYASTARAKMSVGEPAYDLDDVSPLRAAFERGGRAALGRALPADYVRALSACGTADDVRAKVGEYRDAGVDIPLVRPAAERQLPALLAAFGHRRA